jgi:hypothetical protein
VFQEAVNQSQVEAVLNAIYFCQIHHACNIRGRCPVVIFPKILLVLPILFWHLSSPNKTWEIMKTKISNPSLRFTHLETHLTFGHNKTYNVLIRTTVWLDLGPRERKEIFIHIWIHTKKTCLIWNDGPDFEDYQADTCHWTAWAERAPCRCLSIAAVLDLNKRGWLQFTAWDLTEPTGLSSVHFYGFYVTQLSVRSEYGFSECRTTWKQLECFLQGPLKIFFSRIKIKWQTSLLLIRKRREPP